MAILTNGEVHGPLHGYREWMLGVYDGRDGQARQAKSTADHASGERDELVARRGSHAVYDHSVAVIERDADLRQRAADRFRLGPPVDEPAGHLGHYRRCPGDDKLRTTPFAGLAGYAVRGLDRDTGTSRYGYVGLLATVHEPGEAVGDDGNALRGQNDECEEGDGGEGDKEGEAGAADGEADG